MLYRLWCEVAPQSTINAASWSGPNWPGPTHLIRDSGFAPPATSFQVASVRAVTARLGAIDTNFAYTLISPDGSTTVQLDPNTTPPYEATLAGAINGTGIWMIEVRYAAASAGTAVAELLEGSAPVFEPYFATQQGAPREHILAIEFADTAGAGCPEYVVLTATVAGQAVPAGGCVRPGDTVRFAADLLPAGVTGAQYQFDFGDGTVTKWQASPSAPPHAYAAPAAAVTASVLVWVPGAQCAPVKGQFSFTVGCCTPNGQPREYWDTASRTCVRCPTGPVTVTASKPSGCAPGSVGAVTLAAAAPAAPGFSFDWAIDGPSWEQPAAQIHVHRTGAGAQVNTSGGWTGAGAVAGGAVDLNRPGAYSVAVLARPTGNAAGCEPLPLATTTFFVDPCPGVCPEGHHWDHEAGACVSNCPPGQHWDKAAGRCVPDQPERPRPDDGRRPRPEDGDGGGGCLKTILCWLLLLVALFTVIASAVVVIIAACSQLLVAGLIGAAFLAGGLALFFAWLSWCYRPGSRNYCRILRRFIRVMEFLGGGSLIATILLAIFQSWCALGAGADAAAFIVAADIGHNLYDRFCQQRLQIGIE